MEKKVNGTWLFLILLAVLLVIVFVMNFVDQSAGSYSGGMLVQLPERLIERGVAMSGGWL